MADIYDPFKASAPTGANTEGIADPFAPGYEKPGTVSTSIKRSVGNIISTAGTTLKDVTDVGGIGSGIEKYGTDLANRNPALVTDIQGIKDNPGTFAKQALAEQAPQFGLNMGGVAAGAKLGSKIAGARGAFFGGIAGGLAPTLFQEYGGIRQQQAEDGIDNKGQALAAAVPATALEMAFGPEAIAAKNILKAGGKVTDQNLAKMLGHDLAPGESRLAHMGKEALKSAGEEAATEVAQTGLERMGANQDLTGDDAANDFVLSGLAGGIAGGVFGGGAAGFTPRHQEAKVDPLAAQSAQRNNDIANVSQAAQQPGAGALTKAVGLNPEATAVVGAQKDREAAVASMDEKVEPAPGKVKSLQKDLTDLQKRQADDEEAQRNVNQTFDDANLPSARGIDVGELDAEDVPQIPPVQQQLALPAPARDFAVSPDGTTQRQSFTDAAQAQQQRADADLISGKPTGIKAPVSEIRNPKDGNPWNNYLAANAFRKKMDGGDDFTVQRLDKGQFVLSRNQTDTGAAPNGEISSSKVDQASNGRPSDNAARSVSAAPGNEPAGELAQGSGGHATGNGVNDGAPVSLGVTKPKPSPSLNTNEETTHVPTQESQASTGASTTAPAASQPNAADAAGTSNASGNAAEAGQQSTGQEKAPQVFPAGGKPGDRPTVGQDEFKAFPKEFGSLGVPRAEMPQVKAEHRGALVNFLNARGVTHQEEEVDPGALKATQAEYSPAKVGKAQTFEGGDRSVLVSSDNHIVDGHHQWLGKGKNGEPVKVIRLNAPIKELLPLVKEFPSSTTDSTSTAQDEMARARARFPSKPAAGLNFGEADDTEVFSITGNKKDGYKLESPVSTVTGTADGSHRKFETEKQAVAYAKKMKYHLASDRSLDEQSAVQARQPAKPTANQKPASSSAEIGERGRLELLRAIKKAGGIEMGEASDITGERGNARHRVAPGLFRKDGRTLDDLATILHEDGYLTDSDVAEVDGGIQKVRDIVGDAIRKQPVIPMHYMEEYTRLRHDENASAQDAAEAVGAEPKQLAELTLNDLDPEDKSDVLDHDLLSRIAEQDPEAFERAAIKYENTDSGLMQWAQEWANDQENQSSTEKPGSAINRGGSDDSSSSASREAGKDEGGFKLESQTAEAPQTPERTAQQGDMFGRNDAAQAVADRQREKDAQRNGNKDVPADVDGGLFSNQQKQADLTREPASEDKASAPGRNGSAIENFGEALPPARRALAKKLGESLSNEDIANLPLSKIWPAEENDAITDPFAAAVAHTARSEIPAKPRVGYKVNRWVEKVQTLRELASQILSGNVSREQFLNKATMKYALRDFVSKVLLLEHLDRADWSRIGEVREAPDAHYFEEGKKVSSPQVFVSVDGKGHWLKGSGEVDDHVAAVKGLLGKPQAEQKMQFEIRRNSKTGDIFINKKGDNQHRRLMTFKDADAARAAVSEKYDELVKAWNGIKAQDNISERDLRNDENRARTGQDWRKGRDVTEQEFQKQFGFRGGEFGKWVSQGKGAQERQHFLNSAYDALMDLSHIIGVPPRAISLNGTLGIAFGSRGSGWASAHYEPSNLVINLTKPRGSGALAHEWFHALDNYFARLRSGGQEVRKSGLDANTAYRNANYITHRPEPLMVHESGRSSMTKAKLEAQRAANPKAGFFAPQRWKQDPEHPAGVRPEVEERFADLVKVLDESPMTARARKLDGIKDTGEGYWSRTLERAARSFENYVKDRMLEGGYHNDFLANVREAADTGKNNERYPYLMPAEIGPIREAFGALFDTIDTKADKDGNVAMYRMGAEKFTAQTPLSTKTDVRSALDAQFGAQGVKSLVDRGILNIVDTVDELPKNIRDRMPAQTARGRVKGLYDGKAAYVVASNIKAEDAVGIVLHEIGEHYGLKQMLGEQGYSNLLRDVRRMRAAGDPTVRSAWNRVEKNYKHLKPGEDRFIREVIAHIGENADAAKAPWFQRVLQAIKQFLWSKGFKFIKLDAEDLRNMVSSSLHRVMDGANAKEATAGLKLGDANPKVAKSPEFKKWFGSSKVVDAEGNPRVVYHGTGANFDTFDFTRGGEVWGVSDSKNVMWFASDPNRAWGASDDAAAANGGEDIGEPDDPRQTVSGAVMMPVYLQIKNPRIVTAGELRKIMDKKGFMTGEDSAKIIADAKAAGHDGVFFPGETKGTDYVVFNPEQIKSATGNRGTFSSADPRIDFALKGKFGSDRADWNGFPPVHRMQPLGKSQEHADYVAAKAGDAAAAVRVAQDLVDPKKLEALRTAIGDRKPTIVPVQSEEATGRNKLPLAYAKVLGKELGLPVDANIVQSVRAFHTNANAFERIASQPAFDGGVVKGRDYLIVDDTQAIGGTLANLRGHIEANGGHVILASALTGHENTGDIALRPAMRDKLIAKHGAKLDDYLHENFGFGIDQLTQGEAGHLNAAPSLDEIRNRLAEGRRTLGLEDDGRTAGDQENGEVSGNDEPMYSLADARAPEAFENIRQNLGDMFDTRRTFNRWWHETVGTQYHKAQVDKDFGRVYNRTQEYLTDVSRYALGAADLAPDILPKFESLSDLSKSGASPRDLKPVADAIFRGTLEDQKRYTDAELRDKFNLNPKQIRLYQQARTAINKSLGDMAVSDMVKLARPEISDEVARQAASAQSMQAARDILVAHAPDLESQFDEKIGRINQLISEGYAPLMRFGEYSLHVVGKDGETQYFGMFEKASDRNRMERLMQEQYPDSNISSGVVNDETYQMFKGMTPETLELFADVTGMDKNEAFQQYLKLAKNNRSAMKRLINRKGIEGYNPDVKRVLAQFLTSNARAASSALHMGEMTKAWQAIPKEKGDVQKQAGRLVQYIQNPREEAQGLRSFLFFNFLGGSVASAMVNMTQPLTMSMPYLAQWGAGSAVKELTAGMKVAMQRPEAIGDAGLRAAMQRAIKEGTVEPHQIHELTAASMRSEGDWGKFEKVRETGRKALVVWGRLFALAEQFNRRSTFAAAYQIGRKLSEEQLSAAGAKDAYDFAVKAVNETQGVYNRGNRPNWARGAVGATLFTFKQYSISYLEFLKRLPKQQRAMALGVLFMAAGANGMPGADDLDDLIDTIAQGLGLNWNTKEERNKAISALITPVLGQGASEFLQSGVSNFLPIDVAGRMGMGNLIPGTGIGLKSQKDKGQEMAEAIGPIGGLGQTYGKAATAALAGDFGAAGQALMPNALQNAMKAYQMAQLGYYRDDKGRRVIDTNAADAVAKAIGFNPEKVAKESRTMEVKRQDIDLNRATSSEIADQWAQGIFEKDQDKINAARAKLMKWNAANPESRIQIQPSAIQQRVKEMNLTRAQRFIKATPKGLRAEVAGTLRSE